MSKKNNLKIILVTVAFIGSGLMGQSCFAGHYALLKSDESYLIQLFDNRGAVTAAIDSVRQFVYNNSEHMQPFHSKKWNSDLMIKSMIRYQKKESSERPHLTCGPRAKSMKRILSLIGIKSYMVQIYTDNQDTFANHTFLNVYNSDNEKWEAQDPDYNLIYLDSKNKRVDAQELIFANLDEIVPVFDNGHIKETGWNPKNVILKNDYFEAVMLWDAFIKGSSLLVINQNKFDLSKKKDDYTLTNKEKVDFLDWCNSIYRDKWHKQFFILLP